jgi:LSD1 subclass zinc finger protein
MRTDMKTPRALSLSEAARIQRSIAAHRDAASCPRCHNRLQVLLSMTENEELDLVSCPNCRTSVVLHLPAGARSVSPAR